MFWPGFPDIRHIKFFSHFERHYLVVFIRILPNFELILAISEINLILEGYIKKLLSESR